MVRELGYESVVWAPECSKDLLSSYESYNQKWLSLREQPVEADLAEAPEDWPWQGEIESLE